MWRYLIHRSGGIWGVEGQGVIVWVYGVGGGDYDLDSIRVDM